MTEMARQNIDHCGPRTMMNRVYGMILGLRCHFCLCQSGPTIVVLGTISQVRTTATLALGLYRPVLTAWAYDTRYVNERYW